MTIRRFTIGALAVALATVGATTAAAIAPGTPAPTRITFQTADLGQTAAYELKDVYITSYSATSPSTPEPITINQTGRNRFATAGGFSIRSTSTDFTQLGSTVEVSPYHTITWTFRARDIVESRAFTGYLKIEGFAAGRRQYEPITSPRDTQSGLPTGGIVATFDTNAQVATFVVGDKTVRRALVPTARSLGIIDELRISVVDSSGAPLAAQIDLDNVTVSPRCTIVGTNRAETLEGTSADDVICGLAGNDVIRAAGGDDIAIGGLGNDTVKGQAGNDDVLGGPGDDSLDGARGTDVCLGAAGTDTATASCETKAQVP